jgi:hypothetical protein
VAEGAKIKKKLISKTVCKFSAVVNLWFIKIIITIIICIYIFQQQYSFS